MTTTIVRKDTKERRQLIELIKEVGGRYRETPVKLATGAETHVYLDLKGVLDRGSRVFLASQVFMAHLGQINDQGIAPTNGATALGGPTMGADVISHAVVAYTPLFNKEHPDEDFKWFSVRDKAKLDHGLGRWIEGAELGPDDKVILTDDVASTGKSLRESYERITETGATVLAVVPLVDRAGKAGAYFAEKGVPYLPVIEYSELGLEAL